jgi:hypothetical protein
MRRSIAHPLIAAFIAILSTACNDHKGLSITEIKPNRGPFMGGDPVHIFGTGFSATQGMQIYFGKNKARSPVIKESGEIIVEPPAGNINETVDVEIIFDDSKRMLSPKAYTYIDPTDTKEKPPGAPASSSAP